MELEKSVKRQVKDTIEYYKVLDNLEEVPIDILRAMYKDLLKDSIPKKKIEDKIKAFSEENEVITQEEYFARSYIRKFLKELLEE